MANNWIDTLNTKYPVASPITTANSIPQTQPGEEMRGSPLDRAGIPITQQNALSQQVNPNQSIPPSPEEGGVMGALLRFLNPNTINYAQNSLQQIGQGNLTPTAMTSPQEVAASAGGPLTTALFGSPMQKQQQGAAIELAGDIQGAKSIAGGITSLGGNIMDYLQGAAQGKTLNPLGASNALEASRRTASTATINGDTIVDAVKNHTYPISADEKLEDIIPKVEERFGGKTLNMQQANNEMNAASDAYTNTGLVRKPVWEKVNNRIYGAIRSQLPEDIGSEIDKQATLHNLPNTVRRWAIPASILGVPELAHLLGWGAQGISQSK